MGFDKTLGEKSLVGYRTVLGDVAQRIAHVIMTPYRMMYVIV
jgi:hypothetical protein